MATLVPVVDKDSFAAWAENKLASPLLRARLLKANLMILPTEAPNTDGPVFTSLAPELLEALNTRGDNQIFAEVPVDDEFYSELILHGRKLNLGKMLVKKAAYPIALGIIANFVWDKLRDDTDRQNAKVRFELIVEHNKDEFRSVKYDGPATAFEKTVHDQVGPTEVPLQEAKTH